MTRTQPFILGIAGGTGSGKSWLARALADCMKPKATLVAMDWYYKDQSGVSAAGKKKLNFDHPSAIDVPLLLSDLKRLKKGERVLAPQYDYASHRRLKKTVPLEPLPYVIVEGLFVLCEAPLRSMLDYALYLDIPADQRLIHRLRRDAEARRIGLFETIRLYENFARPMHERFVHPSSGQAHEVWTELPTPARVKSFARKILKEGS